MSISRRRGVYNRKGGRGARIIAEQRRRKAMQPHFIYEDERGSIKDAPRRVFRTLCTYGIGLLAAMALCALISLLAGCSSTKPVQVMTESSTASVEVRTERVVEIDTVMAYLPVMVEKTLTRDTTSVLENDYAISVAKVLPDGFLWHTLELKPQTPIPTPVQKESLKRDSVTEVVKEIPVPTPYEVTVPAELSNWQKFQMRGFWVVLALMLISAAVKWRKPLMAFIRRMLKQ